MDFSCAGLNWIVLYFDLVFMIFLVERQPNGSEQRLRGAAC